MKKILTMAAAALVSTAAMAQDASFPLEANGGYIDFNDDSNFRDTWYVGGSTGFNFTENAGVRAYYWHALEDGQIDNFDKLEIYGVETKVKAPITESIKPYLVVGGGLLKPYGDYEGENALFPTQDKFFGSAGAGLDLSFINFLSVTGYARAMVSEFDQLDNVGVDQDNDISASWNYGASINFRIGDKKDPFKYRKTEVEAVPMPSAKVNNDAKVELDSYDKDSRIKDLEERIKDLEEKEKREEEMRKLRQDIREELVREYRLDDSSKKKIDEERPVKNNSSEKSEIISRLEMLNNKLDKLEKQQEKSSDSTQEMISSLRMQQLENQKNYEKELAVAIAKRDALDQNSSNYEEMRTLMDERIKLLEERREVSQNDYDRQLEQMRRKLRNANNNAEKANETAKQTKQQVDSFDREYLIGLKDTMSEEEYKQTVKSIEVDSNDTFWDRLLYNHSDVFLGYGFGEDGYGAFLMGARPNYNFAGSNVMFSPELSIGVGDKTTFNLLGNAIFDLNINNAAVNPYLGLGAGFIAPDGDFKPAYNMIFGTELNNVADGKLNVEFAGRNLFKYNQLTIGYDVF